MIDRRMSFSTILVGISLLIACYPPNPSIALRAVYLVQPGGQLPQADLSRHPEIRVTGNFADFKQAARQRIALWIDKNAIPLVEQGWLDDIPQATYPIILVGYNYPWYAFGLQLRICCFMGHLESDFSNAVPGFSVIERDGDGSSAQVIFIQGYNEIPTVDAILKISNDVLEGKIQATPSPTLLPDVSSATPLPIPSRAP